MTAAWPTLKRSNADDRVQERKLRRDLEVLIWPSGQFNYSVYIYPNTQTSWLLELVEIDFVQRLFSR